MEPAGASPSVAIHLCVLVWMPRRPQLDLEGFMSLVVKQGGDGFRVDTVHSFWNITPSAGTRDRGGHRPLFGDAGTKTPTRGRLGCSGGVSPLPEARSGVPALFLVVPVHPTQTCAIRFFENKPSLIHPYLFHLILLETPARTMCIK